MALVGGCGVHVRKSATSARNVSGAFSFAPDFDVAFEQDDFRRRVRRSPQAEPVAVGIDEIGQGLELGPLRLVVGIGEFPGIATLSRRFHLDEADQRVVDADRIIRPGLQMRKRRFADKRQAARREAIEGRQVLAQLLKRRPELVFRRPEMAGLSSLALAEAPKAETMPANVILFNESSKSIEDRLFGLHGRPRQDDGCGPGRLATVRPGARESASPVRRPLREPPHWPGPAVMGAERAPFQHALQVGSPPPAVIERDNRVLTLLARAGEIEMGVPCPAPNGV